MFKIYPGNAEQKFSHLDNTIGIAFKINGNYSANEIAHANRIERAQNNGQGWQGGADRWRRKQTAVSEIQVRRPYNGKAKRAFFYTLYNGFNLTDHFTVFGDLYAKQGSAWPVDVIVIEGKWKSSLRLSAADVPRIFNSTEEFKNKLKNNRPSLQQARVTIEQTDANQTGTGDSGNEQ